MAWRVASSGCFGKSQCDAVLPSPTQRLLSGDALECGIGHAVFAVFFDCLCGVVSILIFYYNVYVDFHRRVEPRENDAQNPCRF
mmetsp:Transcript_3663/g.8858  ORF Transcript_3663/g.8858 Transcript_3663/m.8858 type:complete len:84 (-) Transcript_3663:1293-1544(-)